MIPEDIRLSRRHVVLTLGGIVLSLTAVGCSGDQTGGGGELISKSEVEQLKNKSKNTREFRTAIEKKIRQDMESSDPAPPPK